MGSLPADARFVFTMVSSPGESVYLGGSQSEVHVMPLNTLGISGDQEVLTHIGLTFEAREALNQVTTYNSWVLAFMQKQCAKRFFFRVTSTPAPTQKATQLQNTKSRAQQSYLEMCQAFYETVLFLHICLDVCGITFWLTTTVALEPMSQT